MHAPPKSSYPVIDTHKLLEYDAVLFGVPTRYGNFPAQWKAFWDRTGGIWASGGYWGKYAGLFISTGTPGGGQESTAIASMSTLAHHGFIYVPLGYKNVFPLLANLDEVHGGSPWGAGTFAVSLTIPSYPIILFMIIGRGWFTSTHCFRVGNCRTSGPRFLDYYFQGQFLSAVRCLFQSVTSNVGLIVRTREPNAMT